MVMEMRFLVREFAGLVVLVLGGKEFDGTEKNSTPRGVMTHSRPRVWKRLRHVGFSDISMPDHTRWRCDHAYGRNNSLLKTGLGWGNSLGLVQAHVLQDCTPF